MATTPRGEERLSQLAPASMGDCLARESSGKGGKREAAGSSGRDLVGSGRVHPAGVSGGSPLRRSLSDNAISASPAASGRRLEAAGAADSLRNARENSFWKPQGGGEGGPFSSGRHSMDAVAVARKEEREWIIDLENIDLVKTLGSGGTGEVWQGVWQGCRCAVKILYRQGGHTFGAGSRNGNENGPPPKNQVSKVEKAFQAEVKSLSKLRHPNIVLFMGACRSHVQVMNMCKAQVEYGIVTEYMCGGSIHDHIRRQDWVETASPWLLHSIVKDITLGMIYLHNKGIIHRDLKSRNILTNNNWQVKIADFDLSRIKQRTLYKNDPSSSLIGTPSWMAPELIKGTHYDEKVDVYSFGVVLFELLSGEIPFASLYGNEMNHVRIVYDVVKHGVRPSLPEYVPSETQALIARCWAQDPKERPSFAEVLQVLNEENAAEKYFCHPYNAHLLDENEILSISARSATYTASTQKSSPSETPSGGSSALGSSRASGRSSSSQEKSQSDSERSAKSMEEEDGQGATEAQKQKMKKKKKPSFKWFKRLFKHHI